MWSYPSRGPPWLYFFCCCCTLRHFCSWSRPYFNLLRQLLLALVMCSKRKQKLQQQHRQLLPKRNPLQHIFQIPHLRASVSFLAVTCDIQEPTPSCLLRVPVHLCPDYSRIRPTKKETGTDFLPRSGLCCFSAFTIQAPWNL